MEPEENKLICMYVEYRGERIGESLDVFEDHLIFKREGDFLGVPLNHVKEVRDDTVIIDNFEESEGIKVGEMWKERKSRPVSLEELDFE